MSDEKSKRENKIAVPEKETKKKRLKGYRYLGGGFLPGVPARSLSPTEARIYGLELLDSSPLYERLEG